MARIQYSRYSQSKSADDFDEIMGNIKRLKNFDELLIEEIAKENGIAETMAKTRFRDLKTNQLRKILDTIVSNKEQMTTQGWESIESDFYMIRPHLAYAKGRKLIPEEFYQFVDACLSKIPASNEEQTKRNYRRFVDLMQALVAYSKYYSKSPE